MNDPKQLENIICSYFQGVPEAHKQILEICQNVNYIPLFVQCLQGTLNESVKLLCITLIRRMILNLRNSQQDLPVQSQQMLYSAIIALIQNEANSNVRNNMGELITLLQLQPDSHSTLECTQYALNLIQTGQMPLISTAFYIIYNSYCNFPDGQKLGLLTTIFPVAIQNLVSPDFDCRYNAMNLLNSLLYDIKNFEVLNESNELCDALSKSILFNANRVNTENVDQREVTQIFDLANTSILYCKCFEQYIYPFAELFCNILFNVQINPFIRQSAEESLSQLFQTAIEIIDPLLQRIIDGSINLTIEILTSFPEEENDISDLIEWLQYSLDEEKFYQIFFKKAMDLINSNNIICVRIAFDILDVIVSISPDMVIDEIDTILSLVFTYLNPKNNVDASGNVLLFIPASCAKLIQSICKYDAEDMTIHVEKLIPILFNYIYIPNCLHAIDELTQIVDFPPEKCYAYLQQTMGLINSSLTNPNSVLNVDPDDLLSLLTRFLAMINNADESLFPKIIPLIQQLINSSNFTLSQKVLAINCFGLLVRVCPRSASQMIDNFIKLALSLFSQNDSETNASIVEFLDIVLNNQSKFLEPYIKMIFETLDKIINEGQNAIDNMDKITPTISDEIENEEERDKRYAELKEHIFQMIQTSLNMLVTICSIYPQQTAAFFNPVFAKLCDFTKSEDQDLASCAIQCFDNLSLAFLSLNMDAEPLLSYLISQLEYQKNKTYDTIAEYWKTISLVMANAGRQLIFRKSAEIVGLLSVPFQGKKNIYTEKGDMASAFRLPIFVTFDVFVEELGSDCHQFIGPFIEILVKMANNRQKKSHCYAARSLAKIVATLPPDQPNAAQFMTLAQQTAAFDIKQKARLIKTCGVSTLNIILSHSPNLIFPVKDDLIQYCVSVIQSKSAGAAEDDNFLNECIILLISMTRVFNLLNEGTVNTIIAALDEADVEFDSPNLIQYSLFAEYIGQFSANNEKLSFFSLYVYVIVLSSSQMILRKIDPNLLLNMARTIASIPQDQIIARLQWNMTKYDVLQKNVSLILAQNQPQNQA